MASDSEAGEGTIKASWIKLVRSEVTRNGVKLPPLTPTALPQGEGLNAATARLYDVSGRRRSMMIAEKVVTISLSLRMV